VPKPAVPQIKSEKPLSHAALDRQLAAQQAKIARLPKSMTRTFSNPK
jgi:hypothetical protein